MAAAPAAIDPPPSCCIMAFNSFAFSRELSLFSFEPFPACCSEPFHSDLCACARKSLCVCARVAVGGGAIWRGRTHTAVCDGCVAAKFSIRRSQRAGSGRGTPPRFTFARGAQRRPVRRHIGPGGSVLSFFFFLRLVFFFMFAMKETDALFQRSDTFMWRYKPA